MENFAENFKFRQTGPAPPLWTISLHWPGWLPCEWTVARHNFFQVVLVTSNNFVSSYGNNRCHMYFYFMNISRSNIFIYMIYAIFLLTSVTVIPLKNNSTLIAISFCIVFSTVTICSEHAQFDVIPFLWRDRENAPIIMVIGMIQRYNWKRSKKQAKETLTTCTTLNWNRC